MDRLAAEVEAEFIDIDTGTRTALTLLNRYAARHGREYHRALDKLRLIQKERRESHKSPTDHRPLATDHCILPNEPEADVTRDRSTTSSRLAAPPSPLATESASE